MTEPKHPEKLTVTPAKGTLSLKRTGVEQGVVKQSFSHGRTKAVVVEKVKSRRDAKPEPAPAAPAAAPAATPARRPAGGVGGRGGAGGGGGGRAPGGGATPAGAASGGPRGRASARRTIAAVTTTRPSAR